MIRYGKHISAMNFFGTLANQLDKVLIFHYLGSAQLAIYSFAFAIPEQIKGSFKNLFGIALPKYASLPEDKLRKSIIDKTVKLTLISVCIVIAYILVSPFIYKLLFPKYLEAVFYSQIYVLGLISIPGISLISTYFQVRKDTVTLYKLTVIGNIATLILTYVLIYNFGLVGAVVENGVSWLIMLGVHIYYFSKNKIPSQGNS
jgi:O-antigen/teichoic acid export membrane protein